MRYPLIHQLCFGLLLTASITCLQAKDFVVGQAVDPVSGKTVFFVRSDAPYREYRYGTLSITQLVDAKGTQVTQVFPHFDVQTFRNTGTVRFADSTEIAAALQTGGAAPLAYCPDPDSVAKSGAVASDTTPCLGGGDGGDGNDPGQPTVPNPSPTQIPPAPAPPTQLGGITVTPPTSSVSETIAFESDGYNWTITTTWNRAVTNNGNGSYSDGPWSAPIAGVPKNVGKVAAPACPSGKCSTP